MSSLRAAIIVLLATVLAVPAAFAQGAPGANRPYRIYAITFRGMTDVEKGFTDYFTSRRIPVQITFRDLNRDASRMAGFLEEIRQTKPDLIYTWGTSVTLGVVGPYDKVDPSRHITDIPVVFTMVAAPVLAKIVPDLASSRRNLTGVYNVASTEAQMRAMASYRPFKTMGMIYTPTEQNSVVVLDEIRQLSRKMGFNVVAKPFKLDASKKVTNEGAADMVREMTQQNVEWLYLPPDSYLNTQTKNLIIPAAMESSLPTFASTEGLMDTGALMGLVARYHSIGQFTAYKAEQILVHRMAASRIPVETLTRFSLQVRMDVAEALKLPPPLPMFNYAELLTPGPAPAAAVIPTKAK
ncbi:MAG TPA: ABC transporter substrate-binding protein [Usitatibacter sp.]|nr:ABC transporter substrate-binding protein [Usitatibacter sp.]